jgi:hypothetical protein
LLSQLNTHRQKLSSRLKYVGVLLKRPS